MSVANDLRATWAESWGVRHIIGHRTLMNSSLRRRAEIESSVEWNVGVKPLAKYIVFANSKNLIDVDVLALL